MDKARIIDAVIARLETELQSSRASLASVERAVADAPGAMQSHSDTTRFQQGRVADELHRQLEQKMGTLTLLTAFRRTAGAKTTEKVGMGSLVEIEEGNTIATYLILPEGGGSSVCIDDQTISILTGKAPLASALIGHVRGDMVRFELSRGPVRHLTILDIG